MEIQNRVELLIGLTAGDILKSEFGTENISKVLERTISPAEAAKSIVNSIMKNQ